MKKLRIFIISQEEPFYVPKVIRHLIEKNAGDYEIVGATCLKPHRKNKTMKDWFMERVKVYSYYELFITLCFMTYIKTTNLFSRINYFSVKALYKDYSIPQVSTDDINSPKFLNELNKLDIDVIISISPPQLFKKELLKVPNKYCLNAHGTLLPRHRGVFGSWWMLFEEDKEIGATIHTMEERLDAGEILWQKSVETPDNATQYSIAFQTKKLIALGLIEVLKDIRHDNETIIQSIYEESYHRAPTKEQGVEFRKKNKKIITFSNARLALSKRF
ncbi:MAG: formyltransferase family protein [Brumimicrobium sp.]|nr:formyltransferase family protein [Brumimicrobium sp.]